MIRTRRYKLIAYYGHAWGELFDLEHDPHEFQNLWSNPGYQTIQFDLMKQNFDALACAVDVGPTQTLRF